MNHDAMHTLLDAGVPEPPSGLLAPPIGTIRVRARRRRATAVAATAAVGLLAAAGIGVAIRAEQYPPPPPAASPPGVGASTQWHFAVVGRDGRSLWVVGGPPGAMEVCDPGQVTVRAHGDPMILTAFAAPPVSDCQYEVTVRLDAPLGRRTVLDGSANTPRPVLRESILPRPTYPAGLSLDRDASHLTFNAPRPSWTQTYGQPDGTMIMIAATPLATAAEIPVSESVTVHGHTIGLWGPGPDGGYSAAWETDDWQVALILSRPAGTGGTPRAELLRVLNALVWS